MSPRWTFAIAAVLTVLAAATVLYWSGRHAGAAGERPKVEAARAEAAVASLEAIGARETARRVDNVVRQRETAAHTVVQATQDALKSEDADVPLDEDRAARLRAVDRELCDAARTSPALRIEIPAEAARTCSLYVLPEAPTQADLEIGYVTRGAQLVACEAARRLAVETLRAEHDLEDRLTADR